MPSGDDPSPPGFHELSAVQANGGDRGSAGRRLANDHVPFLTPLEMLGPGLSPWVEEAHDLSRARVGSGDPIPLVVVAHRTREPEVLPDGGPAQRLGMM